MSYLARISARVAGPGKAARTVVPKGLEGLPPPVISRDDTTEEEWRENQHLPETGGDEAAARPELQKPVDEDELAELRRQNKEEEEQPLSPLRREAEEEKEEPIQALRRQQEEEEPVQTLRREEPEPEETVQPIRPIARREEVPLEETGERLMTPTQESLEPDAGPVGQDLAGDEEPPELQALRRRSLPVPGSPPQPVSTTPIAPDPATTSQSPAEPFTSHPFQAPIDSERIVTAGATPHPFGYEDRRPQVIIDQVDVLIHEPAPPADRDVSQRTRDRAMRARYLRRL